MPEFLKVLNLDEDNIRATFGLGLVYMDREETERGREVFAKLVEMEATFDQEHKHMFNEFGIKLRKGKMYEEALQYYSRAQKLTDMDENLLYNIGRVLIDTKEYEKAQVMFAKAFALNPNFTEAKRVLDALEEKLGQTS